MVATKKTKEKKRKLSSARETAAKGGSFDRTSLHVPEGVEFFKSKKAGVYRIDIIPYEVGEGNPNAKEGMIHYERTFHVHRGVGPNNDSYVCPRKNSGKKCPICEHRAKLLKDPDTDEDLIKSLAPKKRQLFNVIDLSDRDKGIQIWDESYHLFGKHLDKKIKDADEDDQEKYDSFHDPETGLMLRVGVSEESGGDYTYYDASNIEFKERKEPYDESIIDDAYNLDELIKELSYAELKKVFLQEDEEEEEEDEEAEDSELEDEEDDEEETKPTKKKAKPKRPAKDEEEEEEEEEPEEDEEEDDETPEFAAGDHVKFKYRGKSLTGVVKKVKGDLLHIKSSDRTDLHIMDVDEVTLVEPEEEEEDEPAPKKKPKGKKASAKDDDEEWDESSEEEEEEEKPAKRKKKPVAEEEDEPFDEDEEENEEEEVHK